VGIVPERTRNALMFDVRQLKRWCLMRVTRFRGQQGGVIISHADITERKLAEIVLQDAYMEIDQHSIQL